MIKHMEEMRRPSENLLDKNCTYPAGSYGILFETIIGGEAYVLF